MTKMTVSDPFVNTCAGNSNNYCVVVIFAIFALLTLSHAEFLYQLGGGSHHDMCVVCMGCLKAL